MKYIKANIFLIFLTLSCSTQIVGKSQANQNYHRKEWPHWTDLDGNCRDTRAEILMIRSLSPVQMDKSGCRVKKGKWEDYYYPETHTAASKVDIDHLIPLKHAHDVGGMKWDKSMKEKFANDPDNLVITNKRYNRQKGAKTISEWLPVHREYACKYVRDWIKIKNKYSLKFTESEKYSIENLKNGCVIQFNE